jgi:hypothetical protein
MLDRVVAGQYLGDKTPSTRWGTEMANDSRDIPPDPFTAMAESATAMHTLFMSYIAAGFSEEQALKLIAYTIAAQISIQ